MKPGGKLFRFNEAKSRIGATPTAASVQVTFDVLIARTTAMRLRLMKNQLLYAMSQIIQFCLITLSSIDKSLINLSFAWL